MSAPLSSSIAAPSPFCTAMLDSYAATCAHRTDTGVQGALRRLSSLLVSYVARHMTKTIARDIARECAACEERMRAAGNPKSSAIQLKVPTGTVVCEGFVLVDRKAAYLDEMRRMCEYPELQRVFTDPCGVLKEAVLAMLQARHAVEHRGLNKDMVALFGGGVGEQDRRRHLKLLYKVSYGKFGNAKTADRNMPDGLVACLKRVSELARRRNALVLLGHAARFGDKCLAMYTDSLLLCGVDPDAIVETMSAPYETWHVEFSGDLAILGATNKHVFADTTSDTTMVRPAQMFGTELQSANWSQQRLDELRSGILRAARLSDEALLRKLYASVPERLEMPNNAGVMGQREPSVRQLVKHVLDRMTASACAVMPLQSSHSAQQGQRYYSTLAQAESAQRSALHNAMVVGVDVKGGTKLYRKFRVVPFDELRSVCMGKPCHVIYCGSNVAYRAHLDWDEITPLPDDRLTSVVEALRQHWREKKGLDVSVDVLRTHTHRDGDKQFAEHVVLVARNEAGEECLFLNVTEIPKALQLDDSFDCAIYGFRKSLRLPGCPKLSTSMDTAHVPVGESQRWSPSDREYAMWCPCVCVDDTMVVHCDAPPPPPDAPAHDEGARILLPSERALLDGWWDFFKAACPEHKCTEPKMRFFELNQKHNQFLINVAARRGAKNLDLDDLMRRVVVPRLQNGRSDVPRAVDCNHRSGNNSYFLLNIDLGTGRLATLRGKTHMPKQRDDDGGDSAESPSKRRRKQVFAAPNVGTVLELSRAVLQRMLRGETMARVRKLRRAEDDECVCVLQLKPKSGCSGYPEDDEMTPLRMRRALMARHHTLSRRRSGEPVEETREGNHQRATVNVSFLVEWGGLDLAHRAIATERQFYMTHYEGKEFTRRVEEFLDSQQQALDGRTAEPEAFEASSPWASVLFFAREYTYKHEVY